MAALQFSSTWNSKADGHNILCLLLFVALIMLAVRLKGRVGGWRRP